ncbi:BRCT domain-containing protein [Aaosphaeria arxii CBS 175.79]|uniref:BRCT domain-containing protein n=1 Tax=Aaosphaeria arxii CBS 175.79 TaxID=1450172 RepID=A0A6A5Y166_9PLEO|nr:BRCT domain-containing protein [Aaosphaeria arxii CBS 175.79]KAF2018943.1 BRCT domain-containing protein [Aaosphaeria arxii CBS 175.79]
MGDTAMLDGDPPIFHGLRIVIIPTDIPEERQQQLADDIKAMGGTVAPFNTSTGRIDDLADVTHIISTTSDFPDYHRALTYLEKPVVKPTWVEASAKVNKLKNPRVYSPDPALFMSELVVCCGNLPESDQEAIAGGVLAMGGQFSPIMSKSVTHLIVLEMEDPRAVLAVSKRLHCHIILPHWFDDCLKVGRKISERPYTLPDPEILKTQAEAGAIPAVRASQSIRQASNPEPVDELMQHNTSLEHLEPPRAIRAFNGKRVMFGSDLGLNDRLEQVVTDLITAGGGEVTKKVEEADIYVCNYREGNDYVSASQANKDVGNLSWLYYLITHNTWTNPMRRLMHYPRPREGIPGFGEYRISISSYTGEARVYLENLVKATGAEFTKTFKQDNTHLIAAHQHSEKYEAAKEWGVNIINHLWLEESYAKCKEQTLTDQKYSFFPPRTNLGEVLGQTEINRKAVEDAFFPKFRKPSKAVKQIIQQDGVPGSSAPNMKPSSDVNKSASPVGEKAKTAKTRGNVSTPVAPRHFEEKENQTPGTTGSRGAKDRALSKLHDAAPDIARFEKEMKRKGGVIHGGRREKDTSDDDRQAKPKGRDSNASKRSIEEVDAEEDEDSTDEAAGNEMQKKKKPKKTPIIHRVLISKDERWQGDANKEAKDKAKLRELGIFITDDYSNVDVMCAPKIVRTKKFVAALACGPTIVRTSYLDFVLTKNKLPPVEKHLLHDEEFEKEHGFRLDEAIERAKQNKKRLLRDWTIYVTDAVTGGAQTYRDIIAANGGKSNMWKGRANQINASKRTIQPVPGDVSQNQEEDEGDVIYLISEAKKSEFPLWEKFRDLAKKHDMVPRIVKTEWLLFVAMAQYVHWDPEWELNEDMVSAS